MKKLIYLIPLLTLTGCHLESPEEKDARQTNSLKRPVVIIAKQPPYTYEDGGNCWITLKARDRVILKLERTDFACELCREYEAGDTIRF